MEDIKPVHPGARPATRDNTLKDQTVKNLLARPKNLVIILLAIGLIILVIGYVHTKNQLKQLSNPQTVTQNETQDLIAKVGKLVVLPTGETPTLATVNDATKLKNQAFFKNAQNGDKVLIYNKAGQAILYRPSTNKIVQDSFVNLNNGQ